MASIIKAGQIHSNGTTARPSEFNFEDMSQTASVYLDSVKQRAAQLVIQAQAQAEQTLNQAREQGQKEADEKAWQRAQAELEARWQTLAPALEQAISTTHQLKSEWMRRWESKAIHLVVAVAERVIRTELTHRPEVTQTWIREALELASSGGTIKLQLNPDDYENLGETREAIVAQFGKLSAADIVPDPSVTEGGCRVTTEHGMIDQQLEAQLARIEEELTA